MLRTILAITVLISAIASPAQAGDDFVPFFHEHFAAYGGGYFMFTDSNLKVNSGGVGVSIDLEDAFGLDDQSNTAVAGLRWRFFKKHRLEAEFFPISRKGTRTIDEEIDLGDGNIVPVGAEVAAGLDLDAVRFNYGYSFILDEKKEFGMQLGFHILKVDFGVDVDPVLPGEPDFDVNLGDDLSAPLPNVGLFGGWAFTDRLAAMTRFQYFYIDIGDVTGQLFQGDLGLQFHLFKYFDLGLDFRIFGVYGSGKNGGDKVELNQINWGPLLSGTLRF
jgi:hypothetical protein